MTAADVLWQHQPDLGGFVCEGCTWKPKSPSVTDGEEFANHQIEVLRVAGYAVVELPKPSYVDDPEDNGMKGIGFNGGPGDKALTDHGVYAYDGMVYDQLDGWTPAQARTIASWWLAAADAADGES